MTALHAPGAHRRLGVRGPLFGLLVLLLCAPALRAEDDERPVDENARLEVLLERFKDHDASVRVQAAEEAAALQHDRLLAPLTRLLADKELGVRMAAIEALAARADASARKKAAAALVTRLKRHARGKGDREELLLLIESLGTLRQPAAIKPLLDPIDLDTEQDEAEARLFAVAEIPAPAAVEALIDFLAKGRRGGRQQQRALANKALQHLTGSRPQEHRKAGHDADRWRAWWKDHKRDFDFQAVIAAREEAEARKEAQAEKRRKQAEERKKKREERKKKRAEKKPKGETPPVVD